MNQQEQPLSIPVLDAAQVCESVPKAGLVTPAATEQDLWNEMVANIDDFAVAKSIVDFFDGASPDLQQQHTVLYLRAKVTIKRNQIAYAEANKAVENARKSSSSGLLAGIDQALRRVDNQITGILLNPVPLGTVIWAMLLVTVVWLT